MLFGIISALSFSTAAGATVHAEVSARGFDLLEELDDAGVSSSAMLDVDAQENQPRKKTWKGCEDPRISCKIVDLVLLKPELKVVWVRGKEAFAGMAGSKLAFIKTKDTGRGVEDLTNEKLEKIPGGITLAFRDVEHAPMDPDSEDLGTADAPRIIIYYKTWSNPGDFSHFWNDVLGAIGRWGVSTIDTIMYHAVALHTNNPSFIRKIAKNPIANTGKGPKTFLDMLIQDNRVDAEQGGKKVPAFPELTDLLTNPELYQDKKKGHKLKVAAEKYQQQQQLTKMEKEFEKERTQKAEAIREKLRKEGEEIDAIFEKIPEDNPAVSEGAVYSAMI